MNLRRLGALLLILLLPASMLAAQEQDVYAELIYYDFGTDVEILIPEDDGTEFPYSEMEGNLDIGMRLPVGSTINTNNGAVEIQLVPNSSVMKLAPDTEFTIKDLSPSRSSGNNDFQVAVGRVRTVASRLSGNAQMRIRSGSALAGVRGTDFSFDADNGKLFVSEGLVDFAKTTGEGFADVGETVQLGAGQFADVFADVFEAANFSAEQFAEQFGDQLDFSDPQILEQVQQEAAEDQAQEEGEESEEESTEEESEEEDSADEETDGDESTDGTGDATAADTAPETDSDAASPDAESDQDLADLEQGDEDDIVMKALGYLGMEIGSITIDGRTYSKVVFQPEFNLGKLRTQLYLPIIYTSNFTDPDDWYRPKGNDEWSFGTDQPEGDTLAMISDAATDLILKFKFIEWGDLRDNFFFQIGNVESMTLGHGILIREYANDADFPAIRRIGLNLGLGFGKMHIQTLVNDLSDPYLYGLRTQFGRNGGMGISFAADLNPFEAYEGIEETELTQLQRDVLESKPAFLNAAVDFDMPIMENDVLSLVLFADAATFFPYLNEGISNGDTTLEPGIQTQAVFTGDGLKNYGIEAGVFGNVLFVDYRLQYQYYEGTFKPGFYSQPYDRIRGDRAGEVVDYLLNPDAERYNSYTMGIFGSGGMDLANTGLSLELGYLWPWTLNKETGDISTDADDYFELGFAADKEALSFLPWEMEFGLEYSRLRFRDVFMEERNARLFDESAILKGEGVVAIVPGINIALTVSTNVLRDDNGNIRYDEDGKALIGPSIGLETRIGN
ncbi:FecR family protein [Salinispira pacifica]|uniref:FecR protein domain-containing protein n=1 Tax=Salinispira pacifica TaxID=1307761 RepID=V5WHG0_9SPIO|nr:FecR family protein [Salinispira pacifica]AHC15035.1 hypothetical protein L21SP2_1650 [Salinispira pacifica]